MSGMQFALSGALYGEVVQLKDKTLVVVEEDDRLVVVEKVDGGYRPTKDQMVVVDIDVDQQVTLVVPEVSFDSANNLYVVEE